MEKRRLGRAGLTVSALGLGCMSMSGSYGERDDAQSMATLRRALDLGINFLDTADIYGVGHNEALIARMLSSCRDQIVLATKCGFVPPGGAIKMGTVDGSPDYIRKACDASLTRLGIETIDLYYLHRADPKVPIEDSVGAMAALQKAGKIRYIGLSEVTPATLRRATNEHAVDALQSEYAIFTRNVEAEILDLCRELGIGFVPYSPLGRGLLTGRLRSREDFALQSDIRHARLPRFAAEHFARNVALVDAIEDIAKRYDATPAQIALAWLLAQGDDIVPIPGASKVKHLQENAMAVSLTLFDADLATLSELADEVSGARYVGDMQAAVSVETPRRV